MENKGERLQLEPILDIAPASQEWSRGEHRTAARFVALARGEQARKESTACNEDKEMDERMRTWFSRLFVRSLDAGDAGLSVWSSTIFNAGEPAWLRGPGFRNPGDPLNLIRLVPAQERSFSNAMHPTPGRGVLHFLPQMIATKDSIEPHSSEQLPASTRVYVQGELFPGGPVPMREIALLSDTLDERGDSGE
jgi:hypothetical protein